MCKNIKQIHQKSQTMNKKTNSDLSTQTLLTLRCILTHGQKLPLIRRFGHVRFTVYTVYKYCIKPI